MMCKKLVCLICLVSLLMISTQVRADLVITNGTFDGGNPGDLDVPEWYDLNTNPEGSSAWWNTASICDGPNPFPDGSAMLGDGWPPSGVADRYIYQAIGTKVDGKDYSISIDYAQPTDGSPSRSVSIKVDIYQGSFDGAADDVDIAAQGLTLICSVSSPLCSDMEIHNFTSPLDLSSANTTDMLWIRIADLPGEGEDPGSWVVVDNVQITSEAAAPELALGIHYVDATDGEAGNTTLATGEVLTATDPGTTGSGADGLWRKRAFANGGTIYEAGGDWGGNNSENCPRLMTSVDVPEGKYEVYAYMWTAGTAQWLMEASLEDSAGNLPLYLCNDPNGKATLAVAEDFAEPVPIVTEADRTMWQIYLGTTGTTTKITVYIDDFAGRDPANGGNLRTWYDGIGYEAAPTPTHLYTFEDGTAKDEIDAADGTLVGGAAIVDGAMVTTAQDQWMSMPGDVIDVNSYEAVTIEAWYIPTAGANTGWSMLAYFGGNVGGVGGNGFFMTTARADDKSRAAISTNDIATPWASESGADGPEYDDGLLHYMASTINATDITLYIDGVLIASTPLSATNRLSDVSNDLALLAKGGYDGDPEWIGAIDQFAIYDVALTPEQIAANYAAGPIKAQGGPSTEGLIAYYAMEGDATDSSGNGLDGALEVIGAGNAATFVAGHNGMAIDLLPSNSGTVGPYVNCGADPIFDFTEAMTVGAWVNIRSIPDVWRAIVAKGDSAWRLATNDITTGFQFAFGGSGRGWPGASSATQVGMNEWHYICGTYDTTNGGSIYIDGVLDGTNADTGGIDVDTWNVWIGGNEEDQGWKPYRLFDGQIDEVRIYNRALSADEVAALAAM
jgi:hypothetical protein